MSVSRSSVLAADDLKRGLCERAEEFCHWLFPNGIREGVNFLVGSIQGEPGRSLVVGISGSKTGVFKDFATDDGGDNLLELLRVVRGCAFAEACGEVARWLGLSLPPLQTIHAPSYRASATTGHKAQSYRVTDAEIMLGSQMAKRLLSNTAACEAIAARRRWKTSTVADLAAEASLGLSEAGRLVFLYDTGAKERWRDERGERRIRFLFGKPDSLWRGGLLPIAQRVFVCEGETDAVSLVDAGAEEDGDTLVVALPSASTFKSWWGPQLAGKTVVTCLDADPAGQAATAKLKTLLAPYVAGLRIVNLQEVL